MNVDFWGALVNSTIVASAVTVSVVFFSALAGFAFAKLDFRGSKALMLTIVITMMVPVQLGVIPLYIEMIHLDWVNNLKAVIAPNLVSAFGVFLMRQYIVQAVRTSSSTPRGSTAATRSGSSGTSSCRRCGRSPRCSACSRSR